MHGANIENNDSLWAIINHSNNKKYIKHFVKFLFKHNAYLDYIKNTKYLDECSSPCYFIYHKFALITEQKELEKWLLLNALWNRELYSIKHD